MEILFRDTFLNVIAGTGKNTNKQKIFLLIHSAYEHEHGAYESHDH